MKREGEQRRASSHRGSEAWGHHRGWSQGAVVGAPSWSEGQGHGGARVEAGGVWVTCASGSEAQATEAGHNG
jgi:hypothetical protein